MAEETILISGRTRGHLYDLELILKTQIARAFSAMHDGKILTAKNRFEKINKFISERLTNG